MLQQDYLLRLIMRFVEALTRSLHRAKDEDDPEGAAEMLETAIGEATEIDSAVLLSLAPDSIAGIMQVSGIDPRVAGYVAHSLKAESDYLVQAGNPLATLRMQQAHAVAKAYGVDLETPLEDILDPEKAECMVSQDFYETDNNAGLLGFDFA